MRTIAIIPARGGSKRLAEKNVREINGKSLVEYAVKSALDSQVFAEIILTSDRADTLSLIEGKYKGSVSYHLRPESLSRDNIKLKTLVGYLIDLLEAEGNTDFNIALLLPTSPLRTFEDIRSANALMLKYGDKIDGVMSVSLLRYPPMHSLRIDKDSHIHAMFPEFMDTQSQNLEPAYIHDGSIIFVRVQSFKEHEDFYMPKMMPFYIDERRAIDINTEFDLKLAEYFMGGNKNA